MKTHYELKRLDQQFLQFDYEDEGEFNRWQWNPINYYQIGDHVDLDNLDRISENYRHQGGSILKSLIQ